MYLFTEFDQVRDMVQKAGFSILVDRAFKVADYATAKDPSVDVVLVCSPDAARR
jgi:hypothetical protein